MFCNNGTTLQLLCIIMSCLWNDVASIIIIIIIVTIIIVIIIIDIDIITLIVVIALIIFTIIIVLLILFGGGEGVKQTKAKSNSSHGWRATSVQTSAQVGLAVYLFVFSVSWLVGGHLLCLAVCLFCFLVCLFPTHNAIQ